MQQNKKILIYYSIFNIGGAERSTLKLINKLINLGHNVDLLLITKGGKFEYKINPKVKIYHLRRKAYGHKFKSAKGLKKIKYIFDLIGYLSTLIEQFLKAIFFRFKSYDSIVIGLHGLSPKFCVKNIKAKKYVQWIRNDLKNCDPQKKATNQINKYNKYIDYYLCVSQTSLDSFIELFPSLNKKAVKIYNLLEANNIIELSKQNSKVKFINEIPKSIKLLSVSRLQDKSKGVLRMADALKELISKGFNVQWYLIGEGEDKLKLKKHIQKLELENYMILLGKKDNPYPYFIKADIITVLSYYEGLCGVVNEAKILKKPLIATEFSGINEQIINNENGIIVKNDLESIIKGLEKLLKSNELQKKIAINGMPKSIVNDDAKIINFLNLIS